MGALQCRTSSLLHSIPRDMQIKSVGVDRFEKSRVFELLFGFATISQSENESQTQIGSKMFPGMFMRNPDKEAALKQLRVLVALFGSWVAVILVAPYVLHYFSDSKDKLVLDF